MGLAEGIIDGTYVWLNFSSSVGTDQLALHLAWDAKNAKSVFSSLSAAMDSSDNNNTVSIFVSTDGGLTLYYPENSQDSYLFGSNPHNSSMFRMNAAYKKPRLFVRKFVSNSITEKTNGNSQSDDNDDEADNDNEEVVSDAEANKQNDESIEDSPYDFHPLLLYELKPATIHLTGPIIVSKDNLDYVIGISGAHLNSEYLQQLLKSATSENVKEDELNCLSSQDLICYLIDDSGHIISSNQDVAKVEAGDFLGSIDPLLMQDLSEEGEAVFKGHEDFNYQALCNDDPECCSLGVRSVFIPSIDFIVYIIQNVYAYIQYMGHVLIR